MAHTKAELEKLRVADLRALLKHYGIKVYSKKHKGKKKEDLVKLFLSTQRSPPISMLKPEFALKRAAASAKKAASKKAAAKKAAAKKAKSPAKRASTKAKSPALKGRGRPKKS